MILNMPYAIYVKYLAPRKRRGFKGCFRSNLPVAVNDISEANIPSAGAASIGSVVRAYRVYDGQMYINAAYKSGALVKAEDFESLLDRTFFFDFSKGSDWNSHAFPDDAMTVGSSCAVQRLDRQPIRKILWDNRNEQAAFAQEFYAKSILNMDGHILMRAPEPAWIIDETHPGKWTIKLSWSSRVGASCFLISELDRAKEFVASIMGGEIIEVIGESNIRGVEYDGAALMQVAKEIVSHFNYKRNTYDILKSNAPTLIIETASEMLKDGPSGAISYNHKRDLDLIQRRWAFEWERLEKQEWWIQHCRSSEELADLQLV